MKGALVVLVALALIISGCAEQTSTPLSLPSDSVVVQGIRPSPSGSLQEGPKESSLNIEQILFNDAYPGIGAGDEFGDGPWNHRVVFAESQNGRVWVRKPKIIAEQASAPEGIIDKEGRIRVYFIDAKNKGVTAAIWHNSRWLYKRVGVEDGAEYVSIVLLDDGNYRIYYQIGNDIYSAISSNGIYFDREAGARYSGNNPDGFDVFRSANGWNLLVSEGGEFFQAESSDGIFFPASESIGIKGAGGNVAKVGDVLELYYHSLYGKEYAVYTASSTYGELWKQDAGIRIFSGTRLDRNGVLNPSVIKIDDNTYQMFYYSPIK